MQPEDTGINDKRLDRSEVNVALKLRLRLWNMYADNCMEIVTSLRLHEHVHVHMHL